MVNNQLSKIMLRLGVGVLIFLFFRVTASPPYEVIFAFDTLWYVYFVFIITVTFLVWGLSAKVSRYFERKYSHDLISFKRLISLFLASTLLTFPIVILAVYFSNYHIKVWLSCPINGYEGFWADTIQGFLLTWLIISGQLINIYYRYSKKLEYEKANMQKELIQAKYESLKNQINPHFLFNSFSILTSLIHKDVDLASDYVSQLSKMYRYILDNKENQMVTLAQEFDLLDSYLFLMKIRHEESIIVNIDVDLDKNNFHLPTLSLQMLVENAVKHNNFNKEHPLKIRIYNENQDYLVVQNDVSKKKNTTQSSKIGLENIRKRYSIKSKRQVVINQDATYFTVKLPVLSPLNLA